LKILSLLSDLLTQCDRRPELKGNKRSAILREEGLRDFKGFSATDYYRYEMGYQPTNASWCPQPTLRGKRQKSPVRSKLVEAGCEDANCRKTTQGKETKSENRLMLWQFVNVLISETCAPSATVAFKNCKRGMNCSCTEAGSAKTNAAPHLETPKTNADEQVRNQQLEPLNAVNSKLGRKSKTEARRSQFNITNCFSETSGIHLKVSVFLICMLNLKLTLCDVTITQSRPVLQ
jgi:hypothetical protein